jgi:sulfite exporter TauE/SafE
VDAALIASATLLGLAGSPHCAAMCSAPCAAAVGQGGSRATIGFHVARLGGYALAGGVAASSVAALAAWSQLSPALRPLWVLLHAAALVLGLWLLVKARQPAWLAQIGRVPAAATGSGWQRMSGPTRAAALGSLWVAWPCGLLQSALLVSSMGSGAAAGAAAMAGFAAASAPGLVLGPWAWRHLLHGTDAAARDRWAARAAGLLLLAASGWALGHGIWEQVAAFCATW